MQERQGFQEVVQVVETVEFQLDAALFAACDDTHSTPQLCGEFPLGLDGVVDITRRGFILRGLVLLRRKALDEGFRLTDGEAAF